MALRPKYVAIPEDLAAVTRIDSAAEQAPESAGLTRRDVERIWSATRAYYRSGVHPVISLAVRRRGKLVLKRSIGHARGAEPGGSPDPLLPATPETPICLFSASKAISALLVHKLAEEGALRLDERVAHYIPEFAQQGKERVTVRQLLAHRAGIPAVPVKNLDYRIIYDWDAAVAMMCAARPFKGVGEKQAYHAITGGFILGELVRRAGGIELDAALRQWIAEPLGCQVLGYGLKPELRAVGAPNVFTGPRPPALLNSISKRVIGAGFTEAVRVSNEPEFLSCAIPAANIFSTADEAGRVFQMLLDGGTWSGRRILREDTVREVIAPVGKRQFDGMLVLPLRFSAGMMLGDYPVGFFGRRSQGAYGHIGLLNVICWADPERELSVALLNNGKSMSPSSLSGLVRLINVISSACDAPHRGA